jgi:hypothetical protein
LFLGFARKKVWAKNVHQPWSFSTKFLFVTMNGPYFYTFLIPWGLDKPNFRLAILWNTDSEHFDVNINPMPDTFSSGFYLSSITEAKGGGGGGGGGFLGNIFC